MNLEQYLQWKKDTEKNRTRNQVISKILINMEETAASLDILEDLKHKSGDMIFTGRSGKSGDTQLMGEIHINRSSGAVKIPQLIKEHLEQHLDKLMEQLNEEITTPMMMPNLEVIDFSSSTLKDIIFGPGMTIASKKFQSHNSTQADIDCICTECRTRKNLRHVPSVLLLPGEMCNCPRCMGKRLNPQHPNCKCQNE